MDGEVNKRGNSPPIYFPLSSGVLNKLDTLPEQGSRAMNFPPSSVLSLFLLLSLLAYPLSEAAPPLTHYCSVNLKASPPVRANIARVLATLQANTPSKGFFSTSYDFGGRDRVYGLAQCRQDVSAEDCRICLRDGPPQTSKLCRGKEEVWIWFDYCFFHYDTKPFAGKFESWYGFYDYSDNNLTDNAAEQMRFARELKTLMGKVQAQALGKNSLSLGRGVTKFTPKATIYALSQCTRDLPAKECSKCLSTVLGYFAQICPYREMCRGLTNACYVRYDTKPFFFP